QQVGGDDDLLADRRRRGGRGRRRAGGLGGGGGRDSGRNGGRDCAGRNAGGAAGRGRGGGSRLGLAETEGRFVAVMDLPLVPQHHHGETKDHPQDGAANVVHEVFFLEWGESRWVNRRGFSTRADTSGTGSCPPAHQGWQRARRRSVRQVPAAAPCNWSACSE